MTAANGVGSNAVQTFTLTVQQAPAITSTDNTTFTVGTPGTFSVTATGFPVPAISRTGTLPSGVDLVDNANGTAALSGTPGAGTAGTYQFTINASNSVGSAPPQTFTLTVQCVAPTVGPPGPALAQGIFGVAYGQTFSATGGIAPHTFSIASGAIPPGLTLEGDGDLTGSPSATGPFSFTVRATDANQCEGTGAYTLSVIPNAQPDAFNGAVGNTQLVVGTTAGSTPTVSLTGSVLANDAGPATLTAGPGVILSANGGSVAMNMNGSFGYTPPVGFAGPTDTFQYTLTDGNSVHATGTVTIGIAGLVWYVDSAGSAGTGISSNPFSDLDAAEAASGPNSTIFVHSGAATTSDAVVLKDGQMLWGQGATFTLGSLTIPAGGKPTLSGTVTIGGNDVTVSSLDISTSSAVGLNNAGTRTGLTVRNDVVVTAGSAAAVVLANVDSTAGGFPSGGITFTRVDASGGANGISLTNVNAGGGSFTVIGDGASDPANTTRGRTTARQGGGTIVLGSGGLLSNTTGAAVLLANSHNVTLRNVSVQANTCAINAGCDGIDVSSSSNLTLDNVLITGISGNHGIDGNNLAGLTLQHTQILNNATAVGVDPLDIWNVRFDDLTGTATISNSLFHTSEENIIGIRQTGTSVLNLMMANSEVRDTTNPGAGNTGLQMSLFDTANVSATVTNSTFLRNRSGGIRYAGNDSSGGGTLTIQNNTFDGGGAVDIDIAHQGLSKTVTFDVSGNTMRQVTPGFSVGINFFTGAFSNASTLLRGTVVNNTIGNEALDDSGSQVGIGMQFSANGAGTMTALVDGNTIRQIHQDAAMFGRAGESSRLNLTLRNNDLDVGPIDGNDFPTYGLDLTATTSVVGHAPVLCANIETNNVAFIGEPTLGGIQALTVGPGAPTIHLQGYGGPANDAVQIGAFLDTRGVTVTPGSDGFPFSGTIQAAPSACAVP